LLLRSAGRSNSKTYPHVIKMNKAIEDTAAREFSVAFYDALGGREGD
jgi:hypothetical protein